MEPTGAVGRMNNEFPRKVVQLASVRKRYGEFSLDVSV
jgi:hypothetical protein